MKLALDLGTRLVSAAWATTGSPDPLPLKDGSPLLDNLLLWRQQKVVAVDDQARGQLHEIHTPDDGLVLEGYRPDFTRHRLRYLTGSDDPPTGDDQEAVRRSTRLSDIRLPVETAGPGYEGPFYRHGLAKAQGGLLRQLWHRLRRLDPMTMDRCDGLLIACPLAFHEFSRRRLLHALKEGLADELFPATEFYQRAIQRVAFVDEPLAVLAGLDYLYGGRARAQIGAANPKTMMTVDLGAGFCTAAVFQVQPGGDGHAVTPGRMLGERTRTDCGGDAVDRALLASLRTQDADLDVFINSRWAEPSFRVPLMDNIRRVKQQFADPAVGEVSVAVPDADYIAISREQFARQVQPLARQVGVAIAEALMDARVAVGELGAAVVVGGTSLLPEFQQAVRDQLSGVSLIAPDATMATDASLAVLKGLARWDDVVGPAAHMASTNRRVALYNSNWTPQEQFPPPSEQFAELYDPANPEEHKHKDFWWGFLQVPPGFSKLTVTLFTSTAREEHLFTLYGIPVDNPDEATVPERYQVYVDVTGDRIYPRIWVWDIQARRFLAKAFDLAKQSEARLADWIESEHAAFSYFDGDRFTGKRDEPIAWLPAVKRLAVGDMIRVAGGDRSDADWNGADPGSNHVPVRTVTRIQPRGAAGSSLPEVRNWHFSEFEVVLDDDPPRNLQNLLIQHVSDGQRDAQLLLTYREKSLAPLASVTEDALADAMGTAPVARPASGSGRMSRAPRLAPEGEGGDPFGMEGVSAEPVAATPVRDESGTDAIPLADSPFAEKSSESWTSGHATWAAAAPMTSDVAAMPDSWSDSADTSASAPAMSTQDLAPPAGLERASLELNANDLPAVLRELRERGIPGTKAEARELLQRLLQNVIDGRIPAPVAAAAATIVRSWFDLAD